MMDAFIVFTLKSSACLSAGYLLYYLLVRRETFHRLKRFVILGIILTSFIVPLVKLQVTSPVLTYPGQKTETAFTRESAAVIPGEKAPPLPVKQKENSTSDLLAMIYLAGASIQVILVLYSLAGILLVLRKSRRLKYDGVRLALVPSGVVPFCFGRMIVLSEKDFSEHGTEMILHEQTHQREFHGLDLLISEICLVLTWYNPFSWLIRHELRQNHEFEADRNVLLKGVDESDYQLLLVRRVAGASRFHIANQFNQSNIKTRIAMMTREKSSFAGSLKLLFFIPLIALMVQVFAQKEIKPAGVPAKENAHGKYLVLAPEQLKALGLERNSSGLFYKNTRFGRSDKGVLCLYFTKASYSGSIILHAGEKITGNSEAEKILKKQPLTSFDFYPVVVAGFSGSRTQDMIAAENDPNMKLLPVQVNMAGLLPGKRSDTLVFWFKPTESLKQALSPFAKADDYLQPCPPDARNDLKKKKSH